MRVLHKTWLAVACAALVAAPPGGANAQDTTRRATSDQRIPVRKGAPRIQESRGEVAIAADFARINALEENAAALRLQLQMLETERTSLLSRLDEDASKIGTLEARLQTAREELFRVRWSLALATSRAGSLESRVAQFDREMSNLKNGSLFGHTGFYMAAGTGVNFTTGTLHSAGYGTGLNVVLPIGWSKPGHLLGVRTEFAAQGLEANLYPGFRNTDPVAWSASAMLTLNLPINDNRTNLFYLMGGGGVYWFDHVGSGSTLADRLGSAGGNATKLGLTGGAGLEFHVLGATSLFVQSAITNVFGETPVATTGNGRSLRWVPLVAGITLR